MDILDEAMLRLEAIKEEKGDLAGVFCYIDNMTFVDGKREAEVLIDLHGWRYDNKGKPVFYSGGFMNVYRLYNPQFTCGSHHLTKSVNEYNTLFKTYNWKQEGIAFYSID